MAKTKAQLVKRALQKIFVLSASEEPKAEDAQLVSDIWASVRLELVSHRVGGLLDNSIPDDGFEAVADYLAQCIAPDFGIPTDAGAKKSALGRVFLAMGMGYSGKVLKTEFF